MLEGFAHGFQTLRDDTEVGYLISAFYARRRRVGVRFDDPAFAVDFPPDTVTPESGPAARAVGAE